MSNEGALATLDDEQAINRLAEGSMLKEIAAEYGVSIPLISAIRTGRLWKSLPMETNDEQRRRG